jgi:hypothetical protein
VDVDAPAVSVAISALGPRGKDVVGAGLNATRAYTYSPIESAHSIGLMDRKLVLPMGETSAAGGDEVLEAGPDPEEDRTYPLFIMWLAPRNGTQRVTHRLRGRVRVVVRIEQRDPVCLCRPGDQVRECPGAVHVPGVTAQDKAFTQLRSPFEPAIRRQHLEERVQGDEWS